METPGRRRQNLRQNRKRTEPFWPPCVACCPIRASLQGYRGTASEAREASPNAVSSCEPCPGSRVATGREEARGPVAKAPKRGRQSLRCGGPPGVAGRGRVQRPAALRMALATASG